MKSVVKIVDMLINSVDGQRILNKIIGADAEKIDFLGEHDRQ